jgi:predicted XRE-type DNA-binding protein
MVSESKMRKHMSIVEGSGNVFEDLGFERDEAVNLSLRSQLMSRIEQIIVDRKLNQVKAAALFNVAQPRISDLRHNKIGSFTIDALVNMLSAAGDMVRIEFGPGPEPAKPAYSASDRDTGRTPVPERELSMFTIEDVLGTSRSTWTFDGQRAAERPGSQGSVRLIRGKSNDEPAWTTLRPRRTVLFRR